MGQRIEKEIDLMIGTEGQLGVVTEVTLKTIPNYELKHFFLLLPRWEEDITPHLEINQTYHWKFEFIHQVLYIQ